MGSLCAPDRCGASSVCDGNHSVWFPRAQHEDVAHPTTHDCQTVGCARVHRAHRIIVVHRRFVTANIANGFRVRNMKTLRTLRLISLSYLTPSLQIHDHLYSLQCHIS